MAALSFPVRDSNGRRHPNLVAVPAAVPVAALLTRCEGLLGAITRKRLPDSIRLIGAGFTCPCWPRERQHEPYVGPINLRRIRGCGVCASAARSLLRWSQSHLCDSSHVEGPSPLLFGARFQFLKVQGGKVGDVTWKVGDLHSRQPVRINYSPAS